MNHTSHDHENANSQQRPTANQLRPDPGTDVDERRRTRKDSAHEQPDGNGDLKAGIFLREQNPSRPDGVEAEEAARRHEGQREQQDACVATSIGRFASRVAE